MVTYLSSLNEYPLRYIIQHQLGFTHVILVPEKSALALRRWSRTAASAMGFE